MPVRGYGRSFAVSEKKKALTLGDQATICGRYYREGASDPTEHWGRIEGTIRLKWGAGIDRQRGGGGTEGAF